MKRFYLLVFLLILITALASNYWDSHKSAIYSSIHNDLDTYKLSEEQITMILTGYSMVKVI